MSTCTPVATAEEIDPETLVHPQWGLTWTLPEVHEILIGPKNDPFCFVVFPGADSVMVYNNLSIWNYVFNSHIFFLPKQTGSLCYVKQYGSKYYDMVQTKSIKEKLTVETPLGNVDSTVSIKKKYILFHHA